MGRARYGPEMDMFRLAASVPARLWHGAGKIGVANVIYFSPALTVLLCPVSVERQPITLPPVPDTPSVQCAALDICTENVQGTTFLCNIEY